MEKQEKKDGWQVFAEFGSERDVATLEIAVLFQSTHRQLVSRANWIICMPKDVCMYVGFSFHAVRTAVPKAMSWPGNSDYKEIASVLIHLTLAVNAASILPSLGAPTPSLARGPCLLGDGVDGAKLRLPFEQDTTSLTWVNYGPDIGAQLNACMPIFGDQAVETWHHIHY